MSSSTRVVSPKPPFRIRAFASFGVLFSSVIAAVAGTVLYLRPEGTLASWTRWSWWGVDKKGWEGIHIYFVAAFLAFAILHLILNWRALVGYLRRPASRSVRATRECVVALVVVGVILTASIARWQPPWTIMDVRGEIKQGSLSVTLAPPDPNAEEINLPDLCALVSIPFDQAVTRLEKAGYPVPDRSTTLGELAKRHGRSPELLFRILTGQ